MIDIPAEYQDLVAQDSEAIAYLATTFGNGAPIISPVWFAYKNGYILIVTEPDSLKVKNMTAQPQVSVLLQDPVDAYRYLQLRGKFIGYEKDTDRLLDDLSQRYINQNYPGTPSTNNIILKIEPIKINTFSWQPS